MLFASCQPTRCSRSGVVHALQAGHRTTIRDAVPSEYSVQIRPVGMEAVHSKMMRARSGSASVLSSI